MREHRPPLSGELTWYRGTILPFASLWQTLHRIGALNAPSLSEFCAAIGVTRGSIDLADVLINKGFWGPDKSRVMDLAKVGGALGEDTKHFRMSDLSHLADWVQEFFAPHIRWCPQCADKGYHSALMSLRSLARCPIHQCPLSDACVCGEQLQPNGKDALVHPGCCPHCQTAIFSLKQMRRPTLKAAEARLFEPVADWIEAASQRVVAPDFSAQWRSRMPADWWHRHAIKWSELLKMPVPAEMTPGDPVTNFELTRQWIAGRAPNQSLTIGGPFSADKLIKSSGPVPTVRELPEHNVRLLSLGPRVSRLSRTAVMSAMDRYIRRHVVGGQHRWRIRFAMQCDALFIHQQIAANPVALNAWIAMLWTMQIDRSMSLRATHDPSTYRGQYPYSYGSATTVRGVELNRARPIDDSIGSEDYGWISSHAMGTALLSLWSEVSRLARQMAKTGDVYWGAQIVDLEGLYHWVAVRGAGRRLQFANARPGDYGLHPLPRREKHVRQGQGIANAEGRLTALLRECAGTTLRFDEADGWSMRPASRPLDPTHSRPPKKHRLLGVAGRPEFYIFDGQEPGTVVVRLRHIAIETCAPTAAEAIGLLRRAVSIYVLERGTDAQALGPPTPRVEPEVAIQAERMREAQRAYELTVWRARGLFRRPFWDGAAYAARAVEEYRHLAGLPPPQWPAGFRVWGDWEPQLDRPAIALIASAAKKTHSGPDESATRRKRD